jgi:hypothetical protein
MGTCQSTQEEKEGGGREEIYEGDTHGNFQKYYLCNGKTTENLNLVSGTEAGVLRVLQFPLTILIPPAAPYSFII